MREGNKSFIRIRTARRSNAEAGISLLKRRTWYSDDGGDPPEGNNDQDGQDADPNAVALEKAQNDLKLAQKQIGRLNYEAQQNRETSEALEADRLAAEEARLLAAGEHQQIIDQQKSELEKMKTRAVIGDQAVADAAESNEAFIASLSEADRDLIPDELSTTQLAKWINKNRTRLTTPAAPELNAGSGADSGGSNNKPIVLTALQKQMCKDAHMSEDDYIKVLQREVQSSS